MLIQYYKSNDKIKIEEISSSLFNIIFILFFIIAVIQYFFAPNIIGLILPGFTGQDLVVTIELFRVQAFLSIFTALSSLLLALHYTFDMMYRTIIYPIFVQLFQLLVVWFLNEDFGVYSLLIALSVNQILLFIFYAIPFYKFYKFKIIFNSELKNISNKLLPLIVSEGFSKSNIVIDRFFASSLSTGSITFLQYGEKIIKIISDFINKGISLVSLRKFSLLVDNNKEFQILFYKIYKTMIFIIVPTVFLIVIYLDNVLSFLTLSNKLTLQDTKKIYLVSLSFVGILIGGSLTSSVTNAFYAKGLTKTVAKLNIIIQIFSVILKISLFFYFGFWGLPIAFSISSISGSVLLFILYNFYIYKFDKILLINYFIKIIIISTISFLLTELIINSNFDSVIYQLILGVLMYLSVFFLLSVKFEKDISKIIYSKISLKLKTFK